MRDLKTNIVWKHLEKRQKKITQGGTALMEKGRRKGEEEQVPVDE